jgi:hypothetical protein
MDVMAASLDRGLEVFLKLGVAQRTLRQLLFLDVLGAL